MVPTPCRWEGGEERMQGGPVAHLSTSYFSQSIATSISPLRSSWYRGGTDAFSMLWLDGVDCVSGTSNKEHHHCVPVISLGRPAVSELEGALCRVLHGCILFKSECFTDIDFRGFSVCKMPLPWLTIPCDFSGQRSGERWEGEGRPESLVYEKHYGWVTNFWFPRDCPGVSSTSYDPRNPSVLGKPGWLSPYAVLNNFNSERGSHKLICGYIGNGKWRTQAQGFLLGW